MNWSPEIYQQALHYAAKYHKGQTYGGKDKDTTIEYMNHISCVAMEVIHALSFSPEMNGNLAIQCALLHDTIEDTPVTYDMICEEFGYDVAKGVLALTKDENVGTKQQQMNDSLERITMQPKEVWLVKMADRITNLYSPAHYWTQERIIAYRDEATLIYEKLKEAHKNIAQRLLTKINEYEKFIKVV